MNKNIFFPRIVRYVHSQLFAAYCALFCDYAIVSYQRSGHTWLRVMLAKVISLKYGIKELQLDLVKMAKKDKNIPKIGIYHLSTPFMNINIDWKNFAFNGIYPKNDKVSINKSLKKKRIIFLIRDPRDVVVSLYFDLVKRHALYNGEISEFIREKFALNRIIRAMNMWHKEMRKRDKDFLLLKYEDLRKDTYKELKKAVSFLNIPAEDEIIKKAVEFGSMENMRKMEMNNTFNDHRLKLKDIKDKESYKVRKGKVGGYVDYLKSEDIDYINNKIRQDLTLPYYK